MWNNQEMLTERDLNSGHILQPVSIPANHGKVPQNKGCLSLPLFWKIWSESEYHLEEFKPHVCDLELRCLTSYCLFPVAGDKHRCLTFKDVVDIGYFISTGIDLCPGLLILLDQDSYLGFYYFSPIRLLTYLNILALGVLGLGYDLSLA